MRKREKGKVLLIDVAAQMQPFQLASMKSRTFCSITLLFSISCGSSFFLCFLGGTYLHPIYFPQLACFPGAAHDDKLKLLYHVKCVEGLQL